MDYADFNFFGSGLSGLGIWILCLALAGCGKAQISASCLLSGNGDYKCNFKNAGNAEGSSCNYMFLGNKSEFLGSSEFSRPYLSRNFSDDRYLKNSDLDSEKIIAKEKKTKEAKELANTMIEWQYGVLKKKLIHSGKKIEDYINENRTKIAIDIYKHMGYGVSGEICSGLIRPSDVREITGRATFSSEYIHNISPAEACHLGQGGDWGDLCDFNIKSLADLDKMFKEKIESARLVDE